MSRISTMEYLSHHRIETFLTCEKKLEYYLEGVDDHIVVGDLTPRTFGTALHDAMEELFKIPKDKRTLDILLGFYETACKTSALKWHTYEEGKKILRNWYGRSEDILEREAMCVERKFDVDIDGVRVVGVWDRVDKVNHNTVDITDYKSGFVPMNKWEVENSLQLGIYNLAVRTVFPWVKNVRTIYDFLRWQRTSTEMDEGKLDGLKRYLKIIWDKTRACETPRAVVTGACRWCDYRYKCKEYQNLVKNDDFVIPNIGTENLTGLLKELEMVKSRLDAYTTRKDEIEGWLKDEMTERDIERFEHSGWFVSLTFQRRTNYDYDTVKKIFEPLGLMGEITYFKKTAIDELLKTVTLSESQEQELVASSTTSFTAPSLQVKKKRGRAGKAFDAGIASGDGSNGSNTSSGGGKDA